MRSGGPAGYLPSDDTDRVRTRGRGSRADHPRHGVRGGRGRLQHVLAQPPAGRRRAAAARARGRRHLAHLVGDGCDPDVPPVAGVDPRRARREQLASLAVPARHRQRYRGGAAAAGARGDRGAPSGRPTRSRTGCGPGTASWTRSWCARSRPTTARTRRSRSWRPRAVSSEVTVELDVPAEMRDGAVLRANVYRPAGEGRWPVLLTRLPYGKDFPLGGAVLDPVQTARQGYVVVVQDTRGRFTSGGDWYPMVHEADDGCDTVQWAASLPYADGQVGTYGAS